MEKRTYKSPLKLTPKDLAPLRVRTVPYNEEDYTDEHKALLDRVYRIIYRTLELAETGNPVFAAELWVLYRSIDETPPEDVLVHFDRAAHTGTLFTTKGVGPGNRSDVNLRETRLSHARKLAQAHEYYRARKSDPPTQEEIARFIGENPGNFSRILAGFKAWPEWRLRESKDRSQ